MLLACKLAFFQIIPRTYGAKSSLRLLRPFAVGSMDVDQYRAYLERRRERLEREEAGIEEPEKIKVKFEETLKKELRLLELPSSIIETSFSRSSGPGGQSVNKTNSKAQVKVNLTDLEYLGDRVVDRIRKMFKHKINKEDQLITTSESSRDRDQNLREAIEKLKLMIVEAKIEPKEKVNDMHEETTEMKEGRIREKRRRSEYKQAKRDKRDW